MTFFTSNGGVRYPVSRIERMTYSRPVLGRDNERYSAKVYLLDGDEYGVEVDDDAIRSIENSGNVIPAYPGFTLLRYWHQPDTPEDPFIEESPIIGWRDRGEDGIKPIVLEEEFGGGVPSAILLPNGVVTDPFNGNWDNRDAWVASTKAEVLKQKAAQAR